MGIMANLLDPFEIFGMHKKSDGSYEFVAPNFQSGNFTLNGQNKASITKSGDSITSNINETPEEQAQRLWRTNTIYNTEKTVGQPSDDLLKRWTDLETSRKNRALAAYDEDVMSPALKAFKENAYSRWGGLDNSQSVIGFDKLLTDRDKQRANLAATYDENLFNLGNQEDQRLMTLANFLQGNQTAQNNTLQGYLSNALNASQLGNSQALSAAGIQNQLAQLGMQQEALDQKNKNDQLSGLLSALGLASMFIPGGQAIGAGLTAANGLSGLLQNNAINSLSQYQFPRTTGVTY